MINGHGDDAFRYNGIRHNFSSNIFSHADLGALKIFLATRLDAISSYPEPEPQALEALIAEQYGIEPDCVCVTNGATEAIYLIAESWKEMTTVIPQPTFSEYADACQLYGMRPGEGGMLWLCNPNNPTGSVVPKAEVLNLAAKHQLLVLDQSYEDYTLEPTLTPAEAVGAGNILQLHSLTKTYCIPGLRVGYVIAAAPLIRNLRQHQRPWSVNALAIEAATWLVKHQVKVIPELTAYLEEAQRLRSCLNALPNITVEPTKTNFMLCRTEGITAAELKERLATRYGILIRDASNFQGLTPYHFRVAAQTKEENELLVRVLSEAPANSLPQTDSLSLLRPLMFVGTGSDVGKSILAAAFCRIFKQEGYCPAPFKAQNMALNSYATPEGLEIGRAQAVQAEAAGIPCHTDMNPLLLKPQSDHTSQVVLNGKPLGNKDAYDYWRRGTSNIDFRKEVCNAFDRLAAKYNPIIMEGAGSVSELNLRDTDLVNLPMARHANASVVLVADIDRGGVFASVYGSIALQTPEDRARIKGIIINKFRGDMRLFDNGRRMLEELCGVPILGVIPYFKDIHIEEEDSVALGQKSFEVQQGKVNVAVVMLQHLSNYTDFDSLEQDPRIHLFYTNNVDDIRKADIIILPGTKSTLHDLYELRRNGCAQAIVRAHREGTTVLGICGGYQMMGVEVRDPEHVEGDIERLPGLGLLPVTTTMSGEKVTQQVACEYGSGYEIHMGETRPFGNAKASPLLHLSDGREDGYLVDDRCMGTYLHGILDNAPFVEFLLQPFSDKMAKAEETFDYQVFKEEQYDKLADHVRRHIDMDRLYQIMRA